MRRRPNDSSFIAVRRMSAETIGDVVLFDVPACFWAHLLDFLMPVRAPDQHARRVGLMKSINIGLDKH